MTNKVPDQHVHVHPHSLSRIFAIKKIHVRPVCLAPAHSSTGHVCDFLFLKHTHLICTNDLMSEQRNKQINERKDE